MLSKFCPCESQRDVKIVCAASLRSHRRIVRWEFEYPRRRASGRRIDVQYAHLIGGSTTCIIAFQIDLWIEIILQIVDGRSELLHYMDSLTRIFDKILHMSSTAATRISCRMLEVMMASLTNIIPTEMRSSSTHYSMHVKDFLSIR